MIRRDALCIQAVLSSLQASLLRLSANQTDSVISSRPQVKGQGARSIRMSLNCNVSFISQGENKARRTSNALLHRLVDHSIKAPRPILGFISQRLGKPLARLVLKLVSLTNEAFKTSANRSSNNVLE
jgi:hypothetical protein